MSRAYQQSSAAELQALALASRGDAAVLSEILAEFSRRKTQKARDARRAVEAALAGRTLGPDSGTGPASVRRPAPDARRPNRPDPAAPQAPPAGTAEPAGPGLEARYEALRQTFTEEAELLARWGATPLLPPELRRGLFDAWAARLRAGPAAHPYRLTADDLARDRRTLAGGGEPPEPKDTRERTLRRS
jgi:hypothetical protein